MKKSDGGAVKEKAALRTRRDDAGPVISTAGRIIPRPSHNNFAETFQRAIEGVFSEDEIATAYKGLMDADRVYMDRHGNELRTPDHNIRLAVLKDYLDRTIGRPVERQQILTFQQPATMETLLERIQGSPVLRKTLLEILQQAETEPKREGEG
jgi:hypothetical protein